jgi:hypothetical protein
MCQHLLEVAQTLVDQDFGWLQNLPPAERQQLTGELCALVGGTSNNLHACGERFIRIVPKNYEFACPANHHQEIVEVVRDSACKPPEGFHLL